MDPTTIRFLTKEEVAALFKVAHRHSKRDHALLRLAYHHGLRASEVGLLQKTDLDFTSYRIRVRRKKGSLDGVWHTLHPNDALALRAWLRERADDENPYVFTSRNRKPISRQRLDELMKRYGDEARLPKEKRHFHVLKHSIAIALVNAGETLLSIKDRLGHKAIQNTMVYAEVTSPKRHADALRLFQNREIVW